MNRIPQTICVPFADLIPVLRAKTVRDGQPFDTRRVYALQLMQSKFEYDGALNPHFSPGLFGLEIEWIKAYGGLQSLLPKIIVVREGEAIEERPSGESELPNTIVSPAQLLSVLN
jgi:hypothetical protein